MAFGGAGYRTSSSEPHNGEGVWIFVDDSNIWIEAKKLAARLKGMKTREDPRVRVDIGKLGDVVAHGRRVIKGTLYGSEPPPIDTVWDKIRSKGWKVIKHKRSLRTGKEKKLDHQIVADIVELVCDKENLQYGNTVIIITGDADVMPAVEKALARQPWRVEVKMWKGGLAGDIIKASKTYPDRILASTLDSVVDKIVFSNYRFNVVKSTKDLLRQNAIVLVNPGYVEGWIAKMDEQCLYPFQYYKSYAPDTNDNLVVVVFSMLGKNGLVDMLSKIKNNPDLNRGSRDIFTYFEMVNSRGYGNITELSIENRYDSLNTAVGELSLSSDEDEPTDGADETAGAGPVEEPQQEEHEDDSEEPFTTVKSRKAKSKPKQLYADECPYKFACKHGRDCHYAHSDAEKKFFRKRDREQSKEERTRNAYGYKTMLCNNYALARMCHYGDRCRFAHGEADAICLKCHDRGHFTEGCPESKLKP